MARGKPKKWAAEALVSETESKAIASPEQQKMAGELTAEMLLMMTPIPGGKKLLDLAKKWYSSVFKGKGKAVKVSDKKLLELYQKAHPRKSKGSGKYAPIGDLDVEYLSMSKEPTKVSENVLSNEKLLELYKKKHPRETKAKGGSVKKYARGGGVRKARF